MWAMAHVYIPDIVGEPRRITKLWVKKFPSKSRPKQEEHMEHEFFALMEVLLMKLILCQENVRLVKLITSLNRSWTYYNMYLLK